MLGGGEDLIPGKGAFGMDHGGDGIRCIAWVLVAIIGRLGWNLGRAWGVIVGGDFFCFSKGNYLEKTLMNRIKCIMPPVSALSPYKWMVAASRNRPDPRTSGFSVGLWTLHN